MSKTKPVRNCEDCDSVLSGTDLKCCPDCRPSNANCLAGMECPECGQNERFQISFIGSAAVTDDGSDDDGDHEWDNDSACSCGGDNCAAMGVVKNFRIDDESFKKRRKEALDRLAGKLPPVGFGDGTNKKKYTVIVERLCPQYLRIPVLAANMEAAKKLALEQAGDRDFNLGTSGNEAEYSVKEAEEND